MARLGGDFPKRAAAGVVMMAAALGSAWAGGAIFAVFWAAAALGVLWEWQSLVAREQRLPRFAGGVLLFAALGAIAFWRAPAGWALGAGAGLLAGAVSIGLGKAGRVVSPLWHWGGVLYALALAASVMILRGSRTHGLEAILWLFAVVWGTDIFAYFGGRLVGGKKLWPRVSPGKTWSGFVVGVCSGGVIGALVAPSSSAWGWILPFSLAAAAMSQGGDLFESALKRRFGAKDSGKLIPGHGGVMDRLDGFIAASAFAALVAATRAPLDNLAAGLF